MFGFTFLLDSLARLRLAQGRVAEALGLARECGRRQRAWGIRNPGFLPWGSTLAAALHATGRTTEALDVCDQQIDLARAFGVAREHGMGLLALGTITGDAGTLRAAVDVLRDSPARLELARALTALRRPRSRCARRSSSPSAAARPRSPPAPATTSSPPARGPAARGSPTSPRPRSASRGWRPTASATAQIAETLWVTEKTVEGHLGAAYRKLGIGSRSQLGEALRTIPGDLA